MWTATNPFLQGPFEPLDTEYVLDDLRVDGTIPPELDGTLYRTGSNQYFRPLNPDTFHWFDGDGMVHAFCLKDGKAAYRNRLVETEGLKVERVAGRALYNGIYGHSDEPQHPLPAGAPTIKTVAGINVIRLGNRLLTMHEAEHHYWELDPVTLETRGTFDFGGQVDGMLTAHPHFDAKTNEWLFYALDNERNAIDCFTTGVDGDIRQRHRVAMPFTPWNHDVIFTDRHYIFFFGLIRWRPRSEEFLPRGKSAWFIDAGESRDARILFVDRRSGEATWLHPEQSEYMIGHFLNAYRDGYETIIDATVTPLSGTLTDFSPAHHYPFPLREGPAAFEQPQLWRFVINPILGTVQHHRIGDFSAEFVRLNERVQGSKHRYGFMAGVHKPRTETQGFNCLIKHDYETGRTEYQHLSDTTDHIPGEPVFVPHPQSATEDHGWVLAVWYDGNSDVSELVVHDALNFSGDPVARIKLGHRVPLGFHGNWIPAP